MNKIDHAEKLLQLTEEGTSPFHVTASVERQLQEAGFKKVQLGKNWKLEKGGRYYLVHHGTSLVAFAIGKCYRTGDAFRMAAAHTDFPGLRIKPSPEVKKAGYRQLNVEIYGGAILNTWLDRPLSASGRVALRSDDVFHPQMRLVDFKKPFLTIPNLAIHMNREVNKGVELNRQKDMLPVFGLEDSEEFLTRLAEQLQVKEEDILEYELGLYNTDTGDYLGLSEEFISSPRLDNLTSVQAITTGASGKAEGIGGSMWQHILTMRKSAAVPSRAQVPPSCRRCWSGFCWLWTEAETSFWRPTGTACCFPWTWPTESIPIIRTSMIPPIRTCWERASASRRPVVSPTPPTVRPWPSSSRSARVRRFPIRNS